MRAWTSPAALLLTAIGCSPAASTPGAWPSQAIDESPGGSPACGKPAGKTGVSEHKVHVFGKDRSYTLVVPAGYDSQLSYPLVYVLHGHGGNGAKARAAIDLENAAGGHAIFLYPNGRNGGWDLDSPASNNGDVALFDATLALTQSDYCIDLHRVFVAGFSNGAYMANQLACRRGDRIRGIASHAGGGPYENAGTYDDNGNLVCKGKPVASLVVHGTADTTVAPSEGQKSIDHWTHANHCAGSHASSPDHCAEFSGCTNRVVACKVPGLGHQLWGQAGRVTWSFFDALR